MKYFCKGSLCSNIFKQCQLPSVFVFEEKLGSLPEFVLTTTVKTYRQTCPLS